MTSTRLALLASLLPALAVAQAGAPAAAGGEAAAGEVRTLEERVSGLREKIYRKGRLQDLRSRVGGDAPAAARAVLVHRNAMGGAFRLQSLRYLIDDAPLYARVDLDGDLARADELEVFDGELPPGEHRLSVELVYRGHGGPARRYVDGHRFTVRATHAFRVEPGTVSAVRVVGYERGGVTTELEDRPAVRFEGSARRARPAAVAGDPAP